MYLNTVPRVFRRLDMMFVFDVSIHNFVVFRRGFTLGGFVIGVFNVCSSSVLMIGIDWNPKRRVIWIGHFWNITAACAGNADYSQGREKRWQRLKR